MENNNNNKKNIVFKAQSLVYTQHLLFTDCFD